MFSCRTELTVSRDPSASCLTFVGFGSGAAIGESIADLAFPVFTADTVGFLLGFPLVAPVGALTALGAGVLGLLGFVAHQR